MKKIFKRENRPTILSVMSSAILLTPFLTMAAGAITSFQGFIKVLLDMINSLNRFVIALALLLFIFGIFRLIFAGGSEDEQSKAKTLMLYGIIGLFVMVSVWGLVNILSSTFFGNSFIVPQLR